MTSSLPKKENPLPSLDALSIGHISLRASLLHLIVRIFFREIAVEGREYQPASGPVILTANHPNSLVDPLLLQLFSPPLRIRFVAKAGLFRIPVFGRLLRRMGAIPVVRRMDAAGEVDYTEFFESCVNRLGKGDSVAIFPEGTSLPQPYLAPMRTGPARLFFLARKRGITPCIIPVGLNYERGQIFRSSVLVSISPPLDTGSYEKEHERDPLNAVRGLTAAIGHALKESVFEAQNFRDRELMILLESLYRNETAKKSLPARFSRLRVFEESLDHLRSVCPERVDRLRFLLTRYQRLSALFGIGSAAGAPQPRQSWIGILAGIAGMAIAGVGVLFNWLPYKLCAILVRLTGADESQAATRKILFALFLFPLSYALETAIVVRYLGWITGIIFAACLAPLAYFTLRFFEWRNETAGHFPKASVWFGAAGRRVASQLERLRKRIILEVNALASYVQGE